MNILRLSTVVALGFAMLSGSALAQQNLSPPQSQIQSPSATNGPDLFLSPVVIPPSQLLPSASTTCSINCDTQAMNCRNEMPFRFTGTLTKFVAVLEPLKLSAEEQRRLHEELAKALEAVQ